MMAYMSSIHDSTVEMPNKLMLGREIEVSLDVITEPTLDAVPSQTKYALALQPTSLHIRGSVVTIKERRPNISRETMTSKCPEEDYNARCISSRWYSEIKLDILFQQEQDRASLLKLLPSGQ